MHGKWYLSHFMRKSGFGLLLVFLTILSVSIYSQSRRQFRADPADEMSKLEPALRGVQRSAVWDSREEIPVIVQFAQFAPGQDSLAAAPGVEYASEEADRGRARMIMESGGIPETSYACLAAHSARFTPAALDRLARDPRVVHISIDHVVRGSLGHSARAIGADQVWRGGRFAAGRRVAVAVIDSGVGDQGNSAWDLAGSLSVSLNFVTGTDIANDEYGHGTHVGGIIAGSGRYSGAGNGFDDQYRGIAPGAMLISLRVLDSSGSGHTSDVLAALNWCLQNKNEHGIRVINLSLGHPVYESYKTDPLCQAVEACVRAGMVVVVAAGNLGKDQDGAVVYGGITSPGNDPASITVGAMDTCGTDSRSDDKVASYSSRGPTAIDGLIKPDIVAPGNKIISDSLPEGTLFKNYPSNVLLSRYADGNLAYSYYRLSGTSMAAPVVSGTVALMLEANPALTPNMVRAILAYTAERRSDFDILEQGNGYLNAEGAVRLARAISAGNLNAIEPGDPWLSNPSLVPPYSTISGEAILWGDQILWGDTVLSGSCSAPQWNDSLIVNKQPALGNAILWGDGILWGNSILLNNNLIWSHGAKVGTSGILNLTTSKWYSAFVDPDSIGESGADILAHGEAGVVTGIRVGPAGAWFYPHR
jgi:serine protease AprX